jgi:hypothetical protein
MALEASSSALSGPVALDERPQAPLGGGVSPHPVSVDAQREGRISMPELVHHAARIDAQRDEDRGEGVAELVRRQAIG